MCYDDHDNNYEKETINRKIHCIETFNLKKKKLDFKVQPVITRLRPLFMPFSLIFIVAHIGVFCHLCLHGKPLLGSKMGAKDKDPVC